MKLYIIGFALICTNLFSAERCYVKLAHERTLEISKKTYDLLLQESSILSNIVTHAENSFELPIYTNNEQIVKDIINCAVTGKLPEYAYELEKNKNNLELFIHFTKLAYQLKMEQTLQLCGFLWCKFFDSYVENKSVDEIYTNLKKLCEELFNKYNFPIDAQQKYLVPLILERAGIQVEKIINNTLSLNVAQNYINRLRIMGIDPLNISWNLQRNYLIWTSKVDHFKDNRKLNILHTGSNKITSFDVRLDNFLSDFIITHDGTHIAAVTTEGFKVWKIDALRDEFDSIAPQFFIPFDINVDYIKAVQDKNQKLGQSIHMNSDGKYISIYCDKLLHIVECDSWKIVSSLSQPEEGKILWCKDTFFIEYTNKNLTEKLDIYGNVLQGIKGCKAQLSIDKDQLAVLQKDTNTVLIYSTQNESILYEIECPYNTFLYNLNEISERINFILSPNNKFIICLAPLDNSFCIINVATKQTCICHNFSASHKTVTWSPDSRMVISQFTEEGSEGIAIFDTTINKVIAQCKNPIVRKLCQFIWSTDNSCLNIVDFATRNKSKLVEIEIETEPIQQLVWRDIGRRTERLEVVPSAVFSKIEPKYDYYTLNEYYLLSLDWRKVHNYLQAMNTMDIAQAYTVVELFTKKPADYISSIIKIIEGNYHPNLLLRYLGNKVDAIKKLPEKASLTLESLVDAWHTP